MKISELLLALTGFALQIGLLVVLLWRQLYRRFPWFFGYVLSSLLETVALFFLRNRTSAYFKVYWISDTATTLLLFLALQEVFRSIFQRFYRMTWFKFIFPAIGVLLVIIAVVSALSHPSTVEDRLTKIILTAEVGLGFLQLGLFLFFFVAVRFFRVRWQQYAFGIAFGFGVSASGSLIAFLLRSEFGTKFHTMFRIAVPLSYTLALVVWLITFLTPEPAYPLQGKVLALTPEEMLAEIKQYSSTVKKILSR